MSKPSFNKRHEFMPGPEIPIKPMYITTQAKGEKPETRKLTTLALFYLSLWLARSMSELGHIENNWKITNQNGHVIAMPISRTE